MLIETWIAVLIVLFTFISNFALIASGMISDKRLENERKRNNALQEENAELKRYISVQKTKAIIGVANDFYNEGKKK